MNDDLITQARSLIASSRRSVVFSGAGVSKESGIPTFRDALEGLWAQYEPEELATPRAFERQPELVWNFYQHRRDTLKECQPNPAHYAIAALERDKPETIVITQNVDGFHQQAGNQNVLALHGNIRENRCFYGCAGQWPQEAVPEGDTVPPRCPQCGESSLRPNVVWFGEMLDPALMEAANEAVDQCDTFIIVGTSGAVQPAASLALKALEEGKAVIEINPEATMYSERATVFLPARAAQVLPLLIPSGEVA